MVEERINPARPVWPVVAYTAVNPKQVKLIQDELKKQTNEQKKTH